MGTSISPAPPKSTTATLKVVNAIRGRVEVEVAASAAVAEIGQLAREQVAIGLRVASCLRAVVLAVVVEDGRVPSRT